MTTRQAMAEADRIRPNAIEDKEKAKWLHQLDVSFAETQQAEPPADLWPQDQELIMPEPASQCYVYWLCTMIDWAQQDMQTYQVDQALYDSAYAQAIAWWRRKNRPRVTETGARWHP